MCACSSLHTEPVAVVWPREFANEHGILPTFASGAVQRCCRYTCAQRLSHKHKRGLSAHNLQMNAAAVRRPLAVVCRRFFNCRWYNIVVVVEGVQLRRRALRTN
jgi:hypothetical protein